MSAAGIKENQNWQTDFIAIKDFFFFNLERKTLKRKDSGFRLKCFLLITKLKKKSVSPQRNFHLWRTNAITDQFLQSSGIYNYRYLHVAPLEQVFKHAIKLYDYDISNTSALKITFHFQHIIIQGLLTVSLWITYQHRRNQFKKFYFI